MRRRITIKDFLGGFLRLIRWPNLAIIAVTQYMARIFLIGPVSEWKQIFLEPAIFLIVLSTVLIAAAGYIINDYFDVKIDLINKPEKVIIGRYLKRRVAIGTHQLFNVLGCIIALWVSKWVFLVSVLSATLLWVYASYFKKRPFIGNLIVSLLTASSLLILVVYYPQNRALACLYALFAFGITLIREIIKDIEDVKGDASHGCQTLPIIWGIRRTKLLIYGLVILFILSLFGAAHWLQNAQLGWMFLVLMGFIGTLVYRLVYADTKKEFGMLSNLCKLIMILGMASMVWIVY
ncbi:geranylgeranylglycerol-phosphate geranylgeranyltransferase [Runella sp. MFBS21]|uniref:geranylgeranylglycerol-phosphate geranylgeranyltransferase n=1 Tax=Runella sp. MFBS21 TaxID=3034018 RepID=UPI0023F8A3D1|nr:geranylgeranylglycerol-phosphate geranylgeranyltransferase [Runella sp. MFBS21]MDF7821478.1 geranylgeranylglycerol-phosphate geranylgeranyltransferase [Runella sp. MFBS21]